MFGVASPHLFAHFGIDPAPEVLQIPGEGEGTACRGEELQCQWKLPLQDPGGLPPAEELLEARRQDRGLGIGVVHGRPGAGGQLDRRGEEPIQCLPLFPAQRALQNVSQVKVFEILQAVHPLYPGQQPLLQALQECLIAPIGEGLGPVPVGSQEPLLQSAGRTAPGE